MHQLLMPLHTAESPSPEGAEAAFIQCMVHVEHICGVRTNKQQIEEDPEVCDMDALQFKIRYVALGVSWSLGKQRCCAKRTPQICSTCTMH